MVGDPGGSRSGRFLFTFLHPGSPATSDVRSESGKPPIPRASARWMDHRIEQIDPRLAGFIIPVVNPVDMQAPGSLVGPSARAVSGAPLAADTSYENPFLEQDVARASGFDANYRQ